MEWKPLPIGVDDFEDLISHDYYYVDKTLFMKDLLDRKGKVNLFTRPRRFGKTLNLSMFRYFLGAEFSGAERLFAGTKIMEAGDCVSLKTLAVKGSDLISAGMKPGKAIGDCLQKCLEQVLECPERNTKEYLLDYAEKIRGEQKKD